MNEQLIEEISVKDLEQRIEFSCCGGNNPELPPGGCPQDFNISTCVPV